MLIGPGSAGDARREAVRQRDPHGVPSDTPDSVIEVTCLYGPEVPIYVPFYVDQEGLALLVERLPVPVWIVGPKSQEIIPELRSGYFQIAETIAYWLWQCSPWLRDLSLDWGAKDKPLRFEIHLKEDEDWSQAPSSPPPSIPESMHFTVSELSRTVRFEFSAAAMAHLSGSDNSGERELVRLLLSSAATLLAPGRELTGSINEAMDAYAPIGLKKKLLVFDISQNPLLDPTDLPDHRKVQEYQSDALSDEIATFLRANGRKAGTVPGPERVKLINEVVEFLYSRLVRLIQAIRGDELVSFLIIQHEAVIRRMFFDRLTMPTRVACFGRTSNVTKEVAAELADVYTASTAIRFLIEYVATRPPLGMRPMSLELFDELLAVSTSIINWGFESDYLQFGILDVELAIVPSGRLGASREEFRAARDAFLEVHASGQIGRATAWFPVHWRSPAPNATGEGDGDGRWDSLVSAVGAETGFTLNEWMDAYGEIWNIGSQQNESVKQLEQAELVRRVATQVGWREHRVSELVRLLSLTARDDFLTPAAPYSQIDVYPWRFGRPLSYIRRPLILLPADGGFEMLQWGNRHLLHSAVYFSGLFLNGRYKATSRELKELNGRLNKRRGDEFNERAASVYQSIPSLRRQVPSAKDQRQTARIKGSAWRHRRIGGGPKASPSPSSGVQHLASGRAPHQLANEPQSLFKGTESKKSKVDKLLARTEWVRQNLNNVLDELGLPPNRLWTVEPLVVVDEEVFSPHLHTSPVPVVSLRQLRDAMTHLDSQSITAAVRSQASQ